MAQGRRDLMAYRCRARRGGEVSIDYVSWDDSAVVNKNRWWDRKNDDNQHFEDH
jgi:hypothetical protein